MNFESIIIGVIITLWGLCGITGYLIKVSRFSRYIISPNPIKWIKQEIECQLVSAGRSSWLAWTFEVCLEILRFGFVFVMGPISIITGLLDRDDSHY